jgi:hypothetical protein
MRDAIEFEWAGVPAAALIAEPLVRSAESMKRISGMPDYAYATVAFPIGSLKPNQIRERAAEIAPRVAELLLRGGDR